MAAGLKVSNLQKIYRHGSVFCGHSILQLGVLLLFKRDNSKFFIVNRSKCKQIRCSVG